MLTIYKKVLSVIICVIMTLSSTLGTSKPVMDKKVFDVTLDEQTQEVCEIIKDNSYLDVEKIVTNLPDVSDSARLIGKIFNINTVEFREQMYELRDKYYRENDYVKWFICYFIGAYVSVFEKCEISLVPKNDEFEFLVVVYYGDGTTEEFNSGIFYNPETGLFHGNSDKGMANIGYEFNIKEMIVYATFNSWMRDFGFCFGYDAFCYFTPFFDYRTRRFKFDYADKEWMIQVWKGQYVITNGAEVGVYNREKGSDGTYYNCAGDEDCLKMSFDLYHGDDLILSRSEQSHWWINGFKMTNDKLYLPHELNIRFSIEMKDEEMLKAFCESVDNNIYDDVSYTVDGLTVNLIW